MIKQVVVVAGAPRSGTSWLGQLIDSCPEVAYRFQPLFSHAFKGAISEDSTERSILQFFGGIYKSQDDFLLQTKKREDGTYPTFDKEDYLQNLVFKTCRYQYALPNLLKTIDRVKVIGIVRHPCAVINSWVHAPKEFPAGTDIQKEWRYGAIKNKGRPEEFFGYYKWKEIANLYMDLARKYPDRFTLLSYEALVNSPFKMTRVLYDILDLPWSPQTQQFIKQSTSTHMEDPTSVYKQKDVKDRWKYQLGLDIQHEITSDLEGTRLETFLKYE